jgi:hypothetical protein
MRLLAALGLLSSVVLSANVFAAAPAGGLPLQDGNDLRVLLDEAMSNPGLLYGKILTVNTTGGSLQGTVVKRTAQIVVLQSKTDRQVIDGDKSGKHVFQYSYIPLSSIVSLSIETAE